MTESPAIDLTLFRTSELEKWISYAQMMGLGDLPVKLSAQQLAERDHPMVEPLTFFGHPVRIVFIDDDSWRRIQARGMDEGGPQISSGAPLQHRS